MFGVLVKPDVCWLNAGFLSKLVNYVKDSDHSIATLKNVCMQ